jgi:hypothetical protein
VLPLFVEVILSFALLFWSGALHGRDLRAGTVNPEDVSRLCLEERDVLLADRDAVACKRVAADASAVETTRT